ncbi:MAG: hypothetical protein HDT28_05480 [Clostridiales bacterium]|nr:hypothetical protein [Clostridiales bacterium]
MKDKTARALAIVALVFMGIFVVALITTIIDRTLLGGSIGFIALASGVITLVLFVILKADGRGYSLTQMKNESEMAEIERAIQEKIEQEKQKQKQASEEPPQVDEEEENSNNN